MLSKIWNRAVYQYQSVRQCMDQDNLEENQRMRKQIEKGQITYITPPVSSGMVPGSIQVVKLTPEEQKEALEKCDQRDAEIRAIMQARRERYGLKL